MIVGTAKGEVLIFNNSEMVQSFIYERPKQGSLEDESRVTQIRVFSEGFVVGHLNGVVQFFKQQNQEFRHLNSWMCKVFQEDSILSLTLQEVSDSEVFLAIVGR